MSKFLKFIVNLVLVAAIAVMAAILVPPLLGVSTTIVDSQRMDTNLPMGSVTYSKGVYVTDLAEGDRILVQNDVSAYAYLVGTADAADGTVTARDAYDGSKEQETLRIVNNTEKIMLTIPYIGYVVYAMHSIEGIIILALGVLLVIILFILSELWRKDDDDDDDDDDEYDDDYDDYEEYEEHSAPVRGKKPLAIPETEAYDLEQEVNIRPYMEPGEKKPEAYENVTEEAPAQETAAPAAPQEAEPAASQEAAEAERIFAEPDPVSDEAEAEDVPVQTEEAPAADTAPDAADTEAEDPEQTEVTEPAEVREDTEAGSAAQEERPEEALQETPEAAEPAPAPKKAVLSETDETGTGTPGTAIDMDFLERELEAALAAEEAAEPKQEQPARPADEIADAASRITDETAAEKRPERKADERHYLDEVPEEDVPDPHAESFVAAKRPSLDEILAGAEENAEPAVRRDPVTGISVVDYSDLL